MSTPRIIGIESAAVEPDSNDVLLIMKTENQTLHEIRLKHGAIGRLAKALVGLGASWAPSGAVNMQVMRLTAVKTGIGARGELILDLIFENKLHLPVTFPPHGIQGLQAALAQLQRATGGMRPQPMSGHH